MGVFYKLADFLARLFGKNADFLVGMFSKRTAMTMASLGILVGMMSVLYVTVTGILNGMSYIMPSYISVSASWVIPDNLNELITAYIAFRIALALYQWKGTQLKFATSGF